MINYSAEIYNTGSLLFGLCSTMRTRAMNWVNFLQVTNFQDVLSRYLANQKAGRAIVQGYIANYNSQYIAAWDAFVNDDLMRLRGLCYTLNGDAALSQDNQDFLLGIMAQLNSFRNPFNSPGYDAPYEVPNENVIPTPINLPKQLTLYISYYRGSDGNSVAVTTNEDTTLGDLKNLFLKQIDYESTIDQVIAWGSDGFEMKPDTKKLNEFNINSGDHISIDYPGGNPKFG